MTINKSSIERIRDYLRRQPGHVLQAPAKEPYMAFSAEWQDWSFMAQHPIERLFVGYHKFIDGEFINDPLVIVDWQSGSLIDI